MLKTQDQQDYENVFGITYRDAVNQKAQQKVLIQDRKGKGFISKEQCEKFAAENHIGIAVFIKATGTFRYVNHQGDALTYSSWKDEYEQILFWIGQDAEGYAKKIYYNPKGYDALSNPRIFGEQSDGKYDPLYERNYFLPAGYYNEVKGVFNVAQPITTFACPNGADTAFVHTLLKHIAGDCYPYILSWLRAKMVNPHRPTEVVPIFVGHQGTGKTSFGDAVCRALFGDNNVLVTSQFDSTARFNSDSADALIISIEEKTQEDKRNTSSNIKSRATAKKVRKEHKGVDPIFQDSHTDFILTTNELVPLKFEDRGDQRRFMVMEVDPNFTRDNSALAEEVFTKLYGINNEGKKVCQSFLENKEAIAQFKAELWEQGTAVNYRQFPKTDAYHRCFNLPRTNEAIDIEVTIKSLVPFIKASLLAETIVTKIKVIDEETGVPHEIFLDYYCTDIGAIQFVNAVRNLPKRVCLCRQVIFMDNQLNKPYAHSVVERTVLDLKEYFRKEGLQLMSYSEPPNGGYRAILGKAKWSPSFWFILDEQVEQSFNEEIEEIKQTERKLEKLEVQEVKPLPPITYIGKAIEERIGQRVRFNNKFIYDENGEFETLNELKPGCTDRKAENAQYLDTFLLEADETSLLISIQELRYLSKSGRLKTTPYAAEELYAQRLAIQDQEATRLFESGIVCRVVYSGSKSLHMLVRVADAPSNPEERVWLDAYLKSTLSSKLIFDASTKDPTRLTRAPITMERVSSLPSYDNVTEVYQYNKELMVIGTQKLLAVDWSHVYQLNWRPIYDTWLNEPPAAYEQKGRIMPAKQIYKEAAVALMDGTFFSNRAWNGMRQETFFPAYRLLRMMGYTHEELWDSLLLDIDGYSKTAEIPYWKTRQSCKLIKQIDSEVDDA